MKVKYIRTSSLDQNTARQEVNKQKFDKVYIDQCSGSIKLADRKEGKIMLKDVAAGLITEIHVNSIDRLGRNLIDVLTNCEMFNQRSINLFVENIGMFSLVNSKPSPTFKIILSVLANVSEMEREYILSCQKQGIEIAKAQGKYTGRLYGTKMSDDSFLQKYKKVVVELQNGESLRRAAKLGECSLGTAQRIQKIILSKAA